MTKSILIYSIENINFRQIEDRIEGEFDKINWGEKNKIAESIASIINATGAKADLIPYLPSKTDVNSKIGIRISISNFDGDDFKLESLLTHYISLIQKSDLNSLELFNQNLNPFEEVIRNEANIFLAKYGNKIIRQGLKISIGNKGFGISGRYSPIPSSLLNDDPEELLWATVNGLFQGSRYVHLKLSTDKFLVVYFEQNECMALYKLMPSKTPRQFVIQNKCDPNGKKDFHLIRITPDEDLEVEKEKERDKFDLIMSEQY